MTAQACRRGAKPKARYAPAKVGEIAKTCSIITVFLFLVETLSLITHKLILVQGTGIDIIGAKRRQELGHSLLCTYAT